MDRDFMLQYYKKVYGPDPLWVLTHDEEEFKDLQERYKEAQEILCKLVGGIGSETWHAVEHMLSFRYETEDLVARLGYMKGAEDRERMLR